MQRQRKMRALWMYPSSYNKESMCTQITIFIFVKMFWRFCTSSWNLPKSLTWNMYAMLNFPMHTSPRFWMTVYSAWPVQDSTLKTGEERPVQTETVYLVSIPESGNSHEWRCSPHPQIPTCHLFTFWIKYTDWNDLFLYVIHYPRKYLVSSKSVQLKSGAK